jgi:mRNA interferase RelE/StbE
MKPVVYSKAAAKALRRMPANAASLIRAKIGQYANDPASLANNVKALQGRAGIRLRVGDWRVIMEDDVVLDVIDIGPRGGVYE